MSVDVAVRFRINPPAAGLLHKLAGPNDAETLVYTVTVHPSSGSRMCWSAASPYRRWCARRSTARSSSSKSCRNRKRIEAEGIRDVQETVTHNITPEYLRLRGIEATKAFGESAVETDCR